MAKLGLLIATLTFLSSAQHARAFSDARGLGGSQKAQSADVTVDSPQCLPTSGSPASEEVKEGVSLFQTRVDVDILKSHIAKVRVPLEARAHVRAPQRGPIQTAPVGAPLASRAGAKPPELVAVKPSAAVKPPTRREVFGSSALEKYVDRQPVIETSHENWFSKMGNAFFAVIAGIALIFFSIPCMIVNERQSARRESLIHTGENECSSVGPNSADADKRGTLVHANEANAQGMKAMEDNRFSAFHMKERCLRMRSTVAAYQWVEHSETKETKDRLGGGTTKKTTYSYTKEWKDEEVSSASFKEKSNQNRLACPGLKLGSVTSTCELVHYGEAFVLPTDLVEQLNEFQDASKDVGESVTYNTSRFGKADGYYYFPAKRSQPEIGDTRAKFEYILDGPATVVALQAPAAQRDSFLPYRMISRGLCGVNEEEQKRRQLAEGAKDRNELYEDDKCSCGPLNAVFYCCLGMWNMVLFCFVQVGPPQIYHLMHGKLSRQVCWKRVESEASMQKWICRAIAWLMLFIGFMSIFQPIFTALEIVPLLGPTFSSILSFAVGLVALIATLAVAVLVMSLAYLIYRPMIGLFYLALTAVIVAIPIVISHVMNHG